MDTLTFISELIDAVTWPIAACIALAYFKDPITFLIKSMRRFRAGDFAFEVDQALSTGNPQADRLISELQEGSRSFIWLRLNTPLDLPDEEFQKLISSYPGLFRATTVRFIRKETGEAVERPGIKYIGNK